MRDEIRRVEKAARCAFCGKSPAGMRDHIPPKGIFPRPWPASLITVPACRRCNHSTSKIEEEFKVHLSLRVGINTDATTSLWKDSAMRTLRRNPRLRNRIARSMGPIELRSEAGIFLGKRKGGIWPVEVHDPIIEKIIRGLYFNHYGEILADRVQIEVVWVRTLEDLEKHSRRIDPSAEQVWNTLPNDGSVAGEHFRYRYAASKDSPLHSVWVFDFYGAHFTGGYTTPRAEGESVLASSNLG